MKGRAAALVLLTFAAYLPAIHGGFLWDDYTLITENRLVHARDGLYRFWLTTQADDYWPLTSTAWWLQWRWFGEHATGYHVVNIALHAINVVLVWMVLRQLKIPGAWVAGCVFALHPVNVATTAWISEQKNTLSMLFFALAVLSYLRFDEDGDRRWYMLSLAAFLLAMLSKAAVVMLPVVLLLCVWWRRGVVRNSDFLRTAPFFVMAAGLGLVTVWFQHQHRLAVEPSALPVSLAARLATTGSVPWFYLLNAVLPVQLKVVYPQWQIHSASWSAYLLGVALVSVVVLLVWKRRSWGRPVLFALGYFLVMLVPVMGFFDQSFHRIASVADHWQYYAIIGPIALIVAAAKQIGRDQIVRGVAVFGLVALGIATWTRAAVYADAEKFWREFVAEAPDAYIGHVNLGVALARAGKFEESVGHFERTARLRPDYAPAYYNLGGALAQLGRTGEAIQQFRQAVRLRPNDAEAHNNLANALAQAGRLREAISHFEEALRLQPDSAETRANLQLVRQELARQR